MPDLSATGLSDSDQARPAGATMQLAPQVADDLSGCWSAYPGLFDRLPVTGTAIRIAHAIAAQSPGCAPEQVRPAARASLWLFGLDWAIDRQATRSEQVTGLVRRCGEIAAGAAPEEGDPLGAMLADLRDELARTPAFARHRSMWLDETDRMLQAMSREWRWKNQIAAGRLPELTLDRYLDNADNFALAWVNVTHWIAEGDQSAVDHLPRLQEASRLVQQILRLVNDRSGRERDQEWGDLNAYALFEPGAISLRQDELDAAFARAHMRLRHDCPAGAAYLRRQLEFNRAFYSDDDYWDPI